MLRKFLVVPLLAVSLTACGGGTKTATQTGSDVVANASGAASGMVTTDPSGSASSCPTTATKAFAKTRFVADMGLAFGAFNQWILKPFRADKFKSGAAGQKTALVKAAAAGAFAVNRLNAGRKLIDADPTLCKTLKAPFTSLQNAVGSVTDGLKSGNTAGIAGAAGMLEGLRQTAKTSGMNITDKSAPF